MSRLKLFLSLQFLSWLALFAPTAVFKALADIEADTKEELRKELFD